MLSLPSLTNHLGTETFKFPKQARRFSHRCFPVGDQLVELPLTSERASVGYTSERASCSYTAVNYRDLPISHIGVTSHGRHCHSTRYIIYYLCTFFFFPQHACNGFERSLLQFHGCSHAYSHVDVPFITVVVFTRHTTSSDVDDQWLLAAYGTVLVVQIRAAGVGRQAPSRPPSGPGCQRASCRTYYVWLLAHAQSSELARGAMATGCRRRSWRLRGAKANTQRPSLRRT
jgi:hypothetical protein